MNKKTLIWIGVAVAGILIYRHYTKKPETKVTGEETTSNASGTMCTCADGFSGICKSGDCERCCGSRNVRASRS